MEPKQKLMIDVLEAINIENNGLKPELNISNSLENVPCANAHISSPQCLQEKNTKNHVKHISQLKNSVGTSTDFLSETTEKLKLMKLDRLRVLQNQTQVMPHSTSVNGIQSMSVLEETNIPRQYSEMEKDYITYEINQITKILEQRGLSRIQQDVDLYFQSGSMFSCTKKVNKAAKSAVKSNDPATEKKKKRVRKKAEDNQLKTKHGLILDQEGQQTSKNDYSSVLPSSDVALPSATRFLKNYMKRKKNRRSIKCRT